MDREIEKERARKRERDRPGKRKSPITKHEAVKVKGENKQTYRRVDKLEKTHPRYQGQLFQVNQLWYRVTYHTRFDVSIMVVCTKENICTLSLSLSLSFSLFLSLSFSLSFSLSLSLSLSLSISLSIYLSTHLSLALSLFLTLSLSLSLSHTLSFSLSIYLSIYPSISLLLFLSFSLSLSLSYSLSLSFCIYIYIYIYIFFFFFLLLHSPHSYQPFTTKAQLYKKYVLNWSQRHSLYCVMVVMWEYSTVKLGLSKILSSSAVEIRGMEV